MDVLEAQRVINVVRALRSPAALRAIPETGTWDQTTRDALRAFQHEHNSFCGSRELIERGELDKATREALSWWKEAADHVR